LVSIADSLSICKGGHKFPVINGIVDLMTSDSDKNLLDEEDHWDKVADRGRMEVMENSLIASKHLEHIQNIIEQFIVKEWPDYQSKHISIGEIGSGSGSIIDYFQHIEFSNVKYVGADISMKALQVGTKRVLPSSWEVQFVRTSTNIPIFSENSLDIAFAAAALHHLDLSNVIAWISKSLKSGGMFFIYEPSIGNPFSKIGRKLISRNFFTQAEKPLNPNQVKQQAAKYDLTLCYEKGLHFLSTPVSYLVGILGLPHTIALYIYQTTKFIDHFFTSPFWNYYFLQIYKKR
jgi:SAM-dependent methyltransferase